MLKTAENLRLNLMQKNTFLPKCHVFLNFWKNALFSCICVILMGKKHRYVFQFVEKFFFDLNDIFLSVSEKLLQKAENLSFAI